MKNILAVIAHPDDLEIMAGGSIIKWISEGKKVYVLTFTNGVWTAPDGRIFRTEEQALTEEINAARYIGYRHENLKQKALHLSFKDEYVAIVLNRIKRFNIDTLICPFKGDLHQDHQIVSKIALAASRRVTNVLMGQINYYMGEYFTPNIFVNITKTWERKLGALKQYEGEWKRVGREWTEFLNATSVYYGKIIGVKRAEGFFSSKIIL